MGIQRVTTSNVSTYANQRLQALNAPEVPGTADLQTAPQATGTETPEAPRGASPSSRTQLRQDGVRTQAALANQLAQKAPELAPDIMAALQGTAPLDGSGTVSSYTLGATVQELPPDTYRQLMELAQKPGPLSDKDKKKVRELLTQQPKGQMEQRTVTVSGEFNDGSKPIKVENASATMVGGRATVEFRGKVGLQSDQQYDVRFETTQKLDLDKKTELEVMGGLKPYLSGASVSDAISATANLANQRAVSQRLGDVEDIINKQLADTNLTPEQRQAYVDVAKAVAQNPNQAVFIPGSDGKVKLLDSVNPGNFIEQIGKVATTILGKWGDKKKKDEVLKDVIDLRAGETGIPFRGKIDTATLGDAPLVLESSRSRDLRSLLAEKNVDGVDLSKPLESLTVSMNKTGVERPLTVQLGESTQQQPYPMIPRPSDAELKAMVEDLSAAKVNVWVTRNDGTLLRGDAAKTAEMKDANRVRMVVDGREIVFSRGTDGTWQMRETSLN